MDKKYLIKVPVQLPDGTNTWLPLVRHTDNKTCVVIEVSEKEAYNYVNYVLPNRVRIVQLKILSIDDIAEITHCWAMKFFLETDKGNYVWSSPEYGGDNTIYPYDGDLRSFLLALHCSLNRVTSKHVIKDYCGKDVRIIQTRVT